jgi:hypothetical protein
MKVTEKHAAVGSVSYLWSQAWKELRVVVGLPCTTLANVLDPDAVGQFQARALYNMFRDSHSSGPKRPCARIIIGYLHLFHFCQRDTASAIQVSIIAQTLRTPNGIIQKWRTARRSHLSLSSQEDTCGIPRVTSSWQFRILNSNL